MEPIALLGDEMGNRISSSCLEWFLGKSHLSLPILRWLSLILILGCSSLPRPPTPRWTINLVRPDGEVHKTWTRTNHVEPVSVDTRGGVTQLYSPGVGGYYYKEIVAPAGWYLDIERKKE